MNQVSSIIITNNVAYPTGFGNTTNRIACQGPIATHDGVSTMQLQVDLDGSSYPVYRRGVAVYPVDLAVDDYVEFMKSGVSAELLTPAPLTHANLQSQSGGFYKVECAFGGDRLQALDSSGGDLATVIDSLPCVTGYEPEKTINGNKSPWDYSRDIQDDFYKADVSLVLSAWLSYDLGVSTTFNEVVLYYHPDGDVDYKSSGKFSGASKVYIYGRADAPTLGVQPDTSNGWTLLAQCFYSGFKEWAAGERMKATIPLPENPSYRYMAAVMTSGPVVQFGPNAPTISIVAVNVYNFQDITEYVYAEEGVGPSIAITKSCDSSQVAIQTVSDCQITLNNYLGYFNPGNASSPFFGVLQSDGRGDGLRQGVPVRVTANVITADGVWHAKRIFDGAIFNDEGQGGPQAVQVDTVSKQAVIVAKGLLSQTNNRISTPAYQNQRFSSILEDILDRVGVPRQDTDVATIFSSVPWVVLEDASPTSILELMSDALPYLEVREEHDPARVVVRNRGGRYVSQYDFTAFTPNGAWEHLTGDYYDTWKVDYGCVISSLWHYGNRHMALLQRASTSLPSPFHHGTDGKSVYMTLRAMTGIRIQSFSEDKPLSESNMLNQAEWVHGGNWFYQYGDRLCFFQSGDAFEDWFSWAWAGPMRFLTMDITDPTAATASNVAFSFGRGVYPMGVVGFENFVFILTWDYIWPANPGATGETYPAPSSENAIRCNLYVVDISATTPSATLKSNIYNGALPKAKCPTTCIAADGDYFLFSQDSFSDGVENIYSGENYQSCTLAKVTRVSTKLSIWNHAGNPVAGTASFNQRDYFSFGDTNASGEIYRGYVSYWLNDGTLYCAAQPKKINGFHRYEVWSVPVADLYAGTATATLLGVLADDQEWGLVDFFVEDGSAYLLTRTQLLVWEMSEAVSTAFDFGPPFNFAPDIPTEGEDYYNPGRKMTFAHFPHQLCSIVPQTYQVRYDGVHYFAPMWSSQFIGADSGGMKSQAVDAEGKIWVLLGAFSKGSAREWSQARSFSRATDPYTLSPVVVFDNDGGFSANMALTDGAPVANRVSFSPSLYTIAGVVSQLWTQEDPLTFPGGEKTTVEISLNGASGRGYGNSTSTRRYGVIRGVNLFDDPEAVTSITIEGAARPFQFWGHSSKMYLTVDNTNLGAFTLTGMVIYGRALSSVFSNSPAYVVKDDVSKKLIKKWYDKDISTAFSSDKKAADDWLAKCSKPRRWLSDLLLPWYPILEPGDEIGLTHAQEGLTAAPFKALSVTIRGFQTNVTGTQLAEVDIQ